MGASELRGRREYVSSSGRLGDLRSAASWRWRFILVGMLMTEDSRMPQGREAAV